MVAESQDCLACEMSFIALYIHSYRREKQQSQTAPDARGPSMILQQRVFVGSFVRDYGFINQSR